MLGVHPHLVQLVRIRLRINTVNSAPTTDLAPKKPIVPKSNDQICKDKNGQFAMYDSSSNSCGCASGYTFDKGAGKCVTPLTYCRNQNGYNSTYDSSTNSCACESGYYTGSVSKQCVSLVTARDENCSAKYSNTSFLKYDTDGKTNICACNPGYYWNGAQTLKRP